MRWSSIKYGLFYECMGTWFSNLYLEKKKPKISLVYAHALDAKMTLGSNRGNFLSERILVLVRESSIADRSRGRERDRKRLLDEKKRKAHKTRGPNENIRVTSGFRFPFYGSSLLSAGLSLHGSEKNERKKWKEKSSRNVHIGGSNRGQQLAIAIPGACSNFCNNPITKTCRSSFRCFLSIRKLRKNVRHKEEEKKSSTLEDNLITRGTGCNDACNLELCVSMFEK